ncbi:MAG: hypothetical protein IPL25_10230 [Saprospiraceae bacterium]|nr:hypothetical protein [Candidatus Vicinibacter affinis]
MNRIIQYGEWIEENLNGWERTQQISLHASSVLLGIEPTLRIMASIAHLVPQVGAPTSMKYGGKEIGDSINDAGDAIGLVAQLAQIVSSSAGLEASFQRRKQDWEFQLKLSEQELKQVQQQIISAQIRLAMAEKDLEIHENKWTMLRKFMSIINQNLPISICTVSYQRR